MLCSVPLCAEALDIRLETRHLRLQLEDCRNELAGGLRQQIPVHSSFDVYPRPSVEHSNDPFDKQRRCSLQHAPWAARIGTLSGSRCVYGCNSRAPPSASSCGTTCSQLHCHLRCRSAISTPGPQIRTWKLIAVQSALLQKTEFSFNGPLRLIELCAACFKPAGNLAKTV